MYAGCPLVTHVEYADGTDIRRNAYRRGQRNIYYSHSNKLKTGIASRLYKKTFYSFSKKVLFPGSSRTRSEDGRTDGRLAVRGRGR